MGTQTNYKKFSILYVDSHVQALPLFEECFGDEFRIFTAASAKEGLALLEKHLDEVGILLTEQRMPGQEGTWLLEQARKLRPQILRILTFSYADMDTIIQAVNTGAIFRYIIKPWDPVELGQALKRDLEFFMVQAERNQLLMEKALFLRSARN